ncbi:hypothetical protein Ga0100231_024035 [Opitutaceae bacterium TAV4]|nr:hypothetical protein Ga0100231_024035 [Opitutaceae bacterium TAV4]RRK00782.1 hypothetical protein Ga0100230_023610 [Opitutaceae bacterium TAV3]
MPNDNELLSRKELALALKRNVSYVKAMLRDGFPMPGKRATLAEARAWIASQPNFRQKRPLRPKEPKRAQTRPVLTPVDRPTYDALPPHGKAIADVIGIPDLLRLAAAAKNRHVSIPRILSDDSAIVKLIGMDVAQKLHAVFPGEVIQVPQCWTAALKPKAIAAMQKATILGVGIRDLACITGLSESGVRAALRRSVTEAAPMPDGEEGGGGIGSSGGGRLRVENHPRVSVVSEKS